MGWSFHCLFKEIHGLQKGHETTTGEHYPVTSYEKHHFNTTNINLMKSFLKKIINQRNAAWTHYWKEIIFKKIFPQMYFILFPEISKVIAILSEGNLNGKLKF